MNTIGKFRCDACEDEFETCYQINKHITVCERYDDWVRTYKPPVSIRCDTCGHIFSGNDNYMEHKPECSRKT